MRTGGQDVEAGLRVGSTRRVHDTTQAFLEVQNIEALFGQAILAVRDVSLRVEEGRTVALLGANGAGKTTTLKAISNLLGEVRRLQTLRQSRGWAGAFLRR
jgi:ABC-type glutathione transport system ATPase component